MENVKRILCACRMPESCEKAFAYAVSLSRNYGAELYVMYVIHNPFGLEGLNMPVPGGYLEEEYRKILDDTKERLDALVVCEKSKGLAIKELIREGNPTDVILKAVDRERIDILVMSAHREGRIERFLFGHTNEDILRKIPCSILVVRDEPEQAGS